MPIIDTTNHHLDMSLSCPPRVKPKKSKKKKKDNRGFSEAVDDLLGLSFNDMPKPFNRALPKPMPLGPLPINDFSGRSVLPGIPKNRGNESAPSLFTAALPGISNNRAKSAPAPLSVSKPAELKNTSSDDDITPPMPEVMLSKECMLGLGRKGLITSDAPGNCEREQVNFDDDFDDFYSSPSPDAVQMAARAETGMANFAHANKASISAVPATNRRSPLAKFAKEEKSSKEHELKTLLALANDDIFSLKGQIREMQADQVQMDLYEKKMNVELTDLEDDLEVLSKEKDELSQKVIIQAKTIEGKSAIIVKNNATIAKQNDTISTLKNDLEKIKEENVASLNDVASLLSSLSDQKTAFEELQEDCLSIEKLLEESKANNKQQKTAMDSMQTMMYAYIDEKSALKRQLEESEKNNQNAGSNLNSNMVKMEKQVEDLDAKNSNLQKDLSDKDTNLKQLLKEKDKITAELKLKDSRVVKMEKQIKDLEAKNISFKDLQATKEKIVSELDAKNTSFKDLQATKEKIVSELDAKNTSFKDLQATKEKMSDELDAKNSQVTQMTKKIKDLEAKNTSDGELVENSKRADQQKSLDKGVAEMDAKFQKLEAENTSFKQRLTDKDKIVSDLKKEMESKCHDLNRTINDLKNENSTLKSSTTTTSDMQERCQHLGDLLKKERDANNTKGTRQFKAIQDLERKLIELKRENQALLDEKSPSGLNDKSQKTSNISINSNCQADAQPTLELGQGAIKKTKGIGSPIQKLEETMRMLLLEQSDQLTSLRHQLHETKREVKDVKDHLQEGVAARGDKSRQGTTTKDHRTEAKGLHQKNKALISREMDQLTEQNNRLCWEIDQLTAQNHKLHKDAEEHSMVLLDFENTIEDLKKQHQKEKGFVEDVHKEYKQRMQKAMAAMKEDLHRRKTEIAAGNITAKRIAGLETNMVMSEKTLKALRTELELKSRTIEQLRAQVTNADVIGWRQKNAMITRDLADVSKELGQLKKEKQDLQQELLKSNNKWVVVKKNMDLSNDTKVKRLENALKLSEMKVEKSTTKIEKLKDDLNETRREMKTSLSELGRNNQAAAKAGQNFRHIKIELAAYKSDVKTLQGKIKQQEAAANKKEITLSKDLSQARTKIACLEEELAKGRAEMELLPVKYMVGDGHAVTSSNGEDDPVGMFDGQEDNIRSMIHRLRKSTKEIKGIKSQLKELKKCEQTKRPAQRRARTFDTTSATYNSISMMNNTTSTSEDIGKMKQELGDLRRAVKYSVELKETLRRCQEGTTCKTESEETDEQSVNDIFSADDERTSDSTAENDSINCDKTDNILDTASKQYSGTLATPTSFRINI